MFQVSRAFREAMEGASECHEESVRLSAVDAFQGSQDSLQGGDTMASMKDELMVQAANKADFVEPVKVAGFVKANQRQLEVSER
ncbi:uncharacterized protein Z520_03234 [Fonsecaea multimorphosa CBS 102226]|uniref:Uncharacterized protein n=1 Tax=Fonsecaea multimorphosa CBS 102226 TaxID=1442371 RepID=A0A0D2HF67_9EURO|nr:uncharacterized protein Z520_03234 [Fonsecaea multimorphosa CBS 102226]KIY00571.1 hypothetical protein Z520_03234 [Fonsecaea multimorphosa CBS 102226]